MSTATKATHTPGPWRVTHQTASDYSWDIVVDTHILATAGRTRDENSEVAANARLIAAAPEMLEALELLVKQGAFPTEAYEKALAVIRKVRSGE